MKPLSDDDKRFLQDLNKVLWNRSTGRFREVHAFENHDRPITTAERKKVLTLIRECELPCVLIGWAYGSLKMMVMPHSDVPGVALRPQDCLIEIGDGHLGVGDKVGTQEQFDAFAKYTHTDRNVELCRFYGLPKPSPRERYEY